jgi:F0F1-type ATP synthase membrane subunit b/b'
MQHQNNQHQHSIDHVELLNALKRAQKQAQDARLEVEEAKAQIKESQDNLSQIADKALKDYPLL